MAECKSKLKETIDLPEHTKTILIQNREKNLIQELADLVEKKYKLMNQLEVLKSFENEEDRVVLDALAKETNQVFKGSSNDLFIR